MKCVCNFPYATGFFPYSPVRHSLFAFSLCVCKPNIKDNKSFPKRARVMRICNTPVEFAQWISSSGFVGTLLVAPLLDRAIATGGQNMRIRFLTCLPWARGPRWRNPLRPRISRCRRFTERHRRPTSPGPAGISVSTAAAAGAKPVTARLSTPLACTQASQPTTSTPAGACRWHHRLQLSDGPMARRC